MPVARHPCPHCGALFSVTQIKQHTKLCPDNPAARERMIAALTDPDRPGVAVALPEYVRRARALGAPSAETLRHRYGTWSAIVKAAGLAHSDGAPETATCPHCHKTFGNRGNLTNHIRACTKPAPADAVILAALTDPARPGHIVTERTYQDAYRSLGAPSTRALHDRYGSWGDVARAFGLKPSVTRAPTGSMAKGPAVEAHDKWAAEERKLEAEALEAERLRTGGLEVCSVRALPDGRVACMLR